jgi:CTP synthase
MQVAVIEFARHKAGMKKAHSTEFNRSTPDPVIALVVEWRRADGSIERRDEFMDLGGTMRLGSYQCRLLPGSRAATLYGKEVITERHRHRYEFNSRYREMLEATGLVMSGVSLDGNLVEIVEIPNHPWFVACQFHPEFTSTPRDGHPLFNDFISAAVRYRQVGLTHGIMRV